ncbi:hypothetical protein HAX54_046762 [Datura stramonium]|uniref:Nodulin-like domain-containing protein n=1 Tax=Datura stramonium TaxID=4076 RepID=A0ABS8WJD9_DATST|nr:hypothetical protein [Datura stramonium]
MVRLKEGFGLFFNNRWLVFVAAMWIQSFAGIGYLFGSISPIIKSSLNYNQKQVARLGVAKDLGDSVGFLAGTLSEILPLWAALLVGAIQNFIGYGWVWLIVTGRSPTLPLWAMCILIFIGTNGETYFNTAALVSGVQNFPKSRGPVVGILKGFAGLGGAIMTQIYALMHSPDHASLIFMIAVGPAMALIKADFWLIFFSLLLGSGSGLTVIDNLGQMSQSLGYDNTHVFVSMISIWNFLGRVGGGYFSEIIVRDYAYPRHSAMAIAQVVMALGHFFFAMGWPGAMYIGTLLVGLGYGAHWAIVPAAASELFGLKNFGALYNFLTIANPAGSLVFSGVIASSIYDSEAAKQAQERHPGQWNGISFLSSFLAVDEPLKCEGAICFFWTSLILCGLCIIASSLSMILVYRTKTVYTSLYGKSLA